MEDIKAIIAENIVTLRKAGGMTQIELAEKLNYSDKAVSKWERGESVPDISVLKAIADLFGVTVDYLITADHDPKELEPRAEDDEKSKKRKRTHVMIAGMSGLLVWPRKTIAYLDNLLNWFYTVQVNNTAGKRS